MSVCQLFSSVAQLITVQQPFLCIFLTASTTSVYARMTSTDMSGKEKIHVNIGTKIIYTPA